ncbi:MAG: lamin tail domain-containing protein [Anaerolineae bacterium]
MAFRRLFWLFMTFAIMISLVVVGCGVVPTGEQVRTELITVQVIVTATPDPNVTPNVIIITTTPDRTQVAVPDGIVPADSGTNNSTLFTGTQIAGNASSADGETDSSVPVGCIVHVVGEGDTIFGLAEDYGVNPFVMLEVNGFTEDTAFLNIGDELTVPIEGCPIEELIISTPEPDTSEETEEAEATAEVTAESTAEATTEADLTPSPTPTITLEPTAVNSEVEIVEVIRAGDVTAEGVRIRNNGRLVDVAGWTLSDAEGNEFVFDDLLIFSNAEHTVYTRSSQNTPIASYWGLEEAVWQPGDVITLRDDEGNAQAVLRIPADDDDDD